MFVPALRQDRRHNCGQTAVAMLSGRSIRDIEKVYGHGHKTYATEHIRVVKSLGFYPDERGFLEYKGGALPPLALVRIAYLKRVRGGKFSSGKTKRSGHLVLWANGQFYDPCRDPYKLDSIPAGLVIDNVLEVLAP